MASAAKTNTQTKDQRLHERFSMQLPVRITAITSPHDTDNYHESITANISSGGAFIETSAPLPVASRVSLEFLICLTDLKKLRFILSVDSLRKFEGKPVWVKATGVVIRHQDDGMAVIFDDDYQLSPMRISK